MKTEIVFLLGDFYIINLKIRKYKHFCPYVSVMKFCFDCTAMMTLNASSCLYASMWRRPTVNLLLDSSSNDGKNLFKTTNSLWMTAYYWKVSYLIFIFSPTISRPSVCDHKPCRDAKEDCDSVCWAETQRVSSPALQLNVLEDEGHHPEEKKRRAYKHTPLPPDQHGAHSMNSQNSLMQDPLTVTPIPTNPRYPRRSECSAEQRQGRKEKRSRAGSQSSRVEGTKELGGATFPSGREHLEGEWDPIAALSLTPNRLRCFQRAIRLV